MIATFLSAAGTGAAAASPEITPGVYLDSAVHILSWAALLTGSFFVLVGAIGMLRMPELFTRMHAASIIDTVGAGFLIAGMMLQAGPSLIALKLLFIMLLFFITSPVATHALAQAALHAGERPELKKDRTAAPLEAGVQGDRVKKD
ncbi:MAG: monovalent cation/H(+) antiporter subunit G [Alphaproteobacteria bacterium]|nr:monovalent cation/H(+) antiporter subunit G [Alphaproteobacteria bacterium]